MPEILSSLQSSHATFVDDSPVLALAAVGHRYRGKLTLAQGNYTFAIVTVEYLTKWVEAKHVTNITSTTIQRFFWQNVIRRYGVRQQITIGNAKYFDSAMFKDFCHQVGMKVSFASVYHPQSNGAVERGNSLIF
jgi:IS30 family transposase